MIWERDLGKGFLCILLLLCGCGSNPAGEKEAAEGEAKRGWAAYNRSDYALAISSFESAIEKDETLADAHNGLGWGFLSVSKRIGVDRELILKAISEFQEAIRRDEANADAWVGLANALFLRRANQSDFQNAIKAIDRALNSGRKFLYRHDYKSESDLRLLKAESLYYLGESNAALSEVKLALNLEPNNKMALDLEKLIRS